MAAEVLLSLTSVRATVSQPHLVEQILHLEVCSFWYHASDYHLN